MPIEEIKSALQDYARIEAADKKHSVNPNDHSVIPLLFDSPETTDEELERLHAQTPVQLSNSISQLLNEKRVRLMGAVANDLEAAVGAIPEGEPAIIAGSSTPYVANCHFNQGNKVPAIIHKRIARLDGDLTYQTFEEGYGHERQNKDFSGYLKDVEATIGKVAADLLKGQVEGNEQAGRTLIMSRKMHLLNRFAGEFVDKNGKLDTKRLRKYIQANIEGLSDREKPYAYLELGKYIR